MPALTAQRKKQFEAVIKSLEKKRKSRIFCFVQNPDEHICHPSFGLMLSQRDKLKAAKIDTLELLIQSGGGHPEIAFQIAKFLRRHCNRFNVIVPMMAKSAATLMCLAADTIYMGELAELGPLDIQIEDPVEKGARPFSPLNEFKSMEYLREHATEILDYFTFLLINKSGMSIKEALHESIPIVTGMMTPLYSRIDPSKIGEYRRSLAIGEEYGKRLLKFRGSSNVLLARKLTWDYPTHDFAIDFDELKELGLPVARLDLAQEDALLDGMSGILEQGESAYGLITASVSTTTTTKARGSKSRKSSKPAVPTPAVSLKPVKARPAA
ncbi:MAG: SDH family Clp fold serine proteinase [Pyrinomonadaceae bacterium]